MNKNTKFLLLITLLLPIFAYPIHSQKLLKTGMIAAYTIPFYTGSGYESLLNSISSDEWEYRNNPVFGFTFGAVFDYRISTAFSLDFEVLASGTGGGMSVRDNGRTESSIIISEINLDTPVVLKTGKDLKDGKKLYMVSGIQFSTLLFNNIYKQEGPEFHEADPDWGIFNHFGAGILTGIGMEFHHFSRDLFLEIRYLHEFTNSLRGPGSINQNTIYFAAGLYFGKREK